MRCRGPGALTMFGRRSTDHCNQAGACLPIRGRAPARSCGAGLPLWPSLARIEGTAGPRQPRHHSKPWAAEGVRRQVSWWGFCSIRSLTTACRRRVAALMVQFPPFGGGVIGKQAAPGPARALWPFRRASHLWRWGFCSIRSLTTACRRRVAPLMVQFPPFGGGVIGKQAAPGPARALWPFRRASHLWRWGFCSIRSPASACRRRVAALMVQFPPFVGALDVGRARPCASHSAIPSVWWR